MKAQCELTTLSFGSELRVFSDLCRLHLFIWIVHLFLQVDKDCSGVKLKVSFQLRLFQLSEIIGVELNKPGAILFESPPPLPSLPPPLPSLTALASKANLVMCSFPQNRRKFFRVINKLTNHEALFQADCVIDQISIAQYPLFIVSVIH